MVRLHRTHRYYTLSKEATRFILIPHNFIHKIYWSRKQCCKWASRSSIPPSQLQQGDVNSILLGHLTLKQLIANLAFLSGKYSSFLRVWAHMGHLNITAFSFNCSRHVNFTAENDLLRITGHQSTYSTDVFTHIGTGIFSETIIETAIQLSVSRGVSFSRHLDRTTWLDDSSRDQLACKGGAKHY